MTSLKILSFLLLLFSKMAGNFEDWAREDHAKSVSEALGNYRMQETEPKTRFFEVHGVFLATF